MKKKCLLLFIIGTLLLLTACSTSAQEEGSSYTGTVECDETNISSETAGMIAAIHVKEGESVKKGQTLAEIDVEGLKIEARQIEAALSIADANLKKLESGARYEEIKTAQAQVEQLRALVEAKEKDYQYRLESYNDIKRLYDAAAVSEQNMKDAQALLDAAEKNLEGTEKQLEAAQYQLELIQKGARNEEVKMAYGEVGKAKAALDLINHKISKQYVKAPMDGVIRGVNYNPGEFIPAYGSFANMLNPEKMWIKIYVPEQELHKVTLNRSLPISVDFLKNNSLKGIVSYISSEAEFTPKNVESKENKQEMVFEVKIQIEGETTQLKPGMLADVYLGGNGNE